MVTGKNSYTLNVDIKQRMSNKTPRFVQYDSAQIIFKIYDSGKQYDLTPFTSAIVTHRLPDGKTIAGQAEFTELNGQRVVVYDYMGSEMEQEGNIETSVGLFVGDTQKVSIMPFNVEIVDDLGDHIDEDVEAKYSVLQVMIGEVTELNATMTANENTRQSNEATRRSQEIQRQTNEDTRKSNENTRISNENTRKTNEDTRQSNETIRESNEATRKTDESGRVSAENTRKSNETTRQNQESGRVSAENTRVSSENTRNSAEDTRKSNETARQSAETARSNAEKTRGTNEDTRKANETTRLSNEDERKTAETGRKSAEDTRVANETARVSAEDTRKANEAERQKQEGIRSTAETERLSNENSRVSAENTRESQESTRQTQESTRQTNTNNAIARLDTAVDSTKLEFKAPVETKEALSTTYSNAQVGWVAQVTTGEDAGKFFRYNGSTWEFQSEIALDAVTDIQNKLHRTDRKTETLIDGVNIIDAPVASPTDIEIQGRTMVSLGNSNLEKDKYYAITDEKYKVITDGKTVSGVGKFQKGETHNTKANFINKTRGETSSNPHTGKYTTGGPQNLWSPSDFVMEFTSQGYDKATRLDGSTADAMTTTSGGIPQQAFGFDVIEQVERNLGIIPGSTVAEKVTWLKENQSDVRMQWYGYGIGPNGNSAQVDWWDYDSEQWISFDGWGHDSNAPSRILIRHTESTFSRAIQDNGFIYFLAYAEPSDGITQSVLCTDYVSLDISLKPTAQLNTRPTIVRVENFEGMNKSGEGNGHLIHHRYNTSIKGIMTPYDSASSIPSSDGADANNISRIYKPFDGQRFLVTTSEPGTSAQTRYSFNVISAVENSIGKIPRNTRQEKAEWLRDNISNITFRWTGFGISPAGPTAHIYFWSHTVKSWVFRSTNTIVESREISNFSRLNSPDGYKPKDTIDNEGFFYSIAYADVAGEGSGSHIYNDYAELEIHLKPTADFRQPRVPLYEVTKDEYDKIGISYSDAEVKRRYPIVQGVQHLENPYVTNPGENLLPPFTDSRWEIHANAEASGPYELKLTVRDGLQNRHSAVNIPVKSGETYVLSSEEGYFQIIVQDKFGNSIYTDYNAFPLKTVKIPSSGVILRIRATNGSITENREWKFRNPMLTLGTEPKPFTPYNPSTLHAPVTLSAVGDKRDVLYQQDGRWYVRRNVREIELTGELSWNSTVKYENSTRLIEHLSNNKRVAPENAFVTKAVTESIIPHAFANALTVDNWDVFGNASLSETRFDIMVHDRDTGFQGDISPGVNDRKRYFNGWRYTDGTTWESVTGNGQTATAEEALTTMPTDYTPYKLTYVLAEPEVIDVTELVEGDIAVSGLTQIEVGAGEIVTEDEDGNRTYTRIPDNEKHNVTAAPDNVKITYEQNIRSAHDALVNDVVQNTSLLSIHERAIVNLFARIRGLELSADEIRQDLDDLRTDFDNLPEPTPPTDGGTA